MHLLPPIRNNRVGVHGESPAVPTLFKFLTFLAVVAGLVYGGMIALVTFVQPEPREMVEVVPPSKLQKSP